MDLVLYLPFTCSGLQTKRYLYLIGGFEGTSVIRSLWMQGRWRVTPASLTLRGNLRCVPVSITGNRRGRH
jgi:hypothetical protein